MICDEAHRLRKGSSIINKTILRSDIDRRWLLTGTPIEKDSLDVLNLASILDSTEFSASKFM
jgi:SNF2 family DNA or RNA helicase